MADRSYNQSGGGYFIALSNLAPSALLYSNTTGFSALNWEETGLNTQSTLISANKVVKDMGKTIVSTSRTFRKFQAIDPAQGVVGPDNNGNPGYLTFYLEVGLPSFAPIARYS